MYIVPPKSKAFLLGSTSDIHIPQNDPIFNIHVSDDLTIDRFILFRMDQKKDRREIEVEVASPFAYPTVTIKAIPIPTVTREIQPKIYTLTLQEPLTSGEYFIYVRFSCKIQESNRKVLISLLSEVASPLRNKFDSYSTGAMMNKRKLN